MPDLFEMQKDLAKARRNKVLFLLGGIALFVVGVALIVLYLAHRELPSLLLGLVSFVWGAILLTQSLKVRDIEELIETRIAQCPVPEDEGEAEAADAEETESTEGAGDAEDTEGAGEGDRHGP